MKKNMESVLTLVTAFVAIVLMACDKELLLGRQ